MFRDVTRTRLQSEEAVSNVSEISFEDPSDDVRSNHLDLCSCSSG